MKRCSRLQVDRGADSCPAFQVYPEYLCTIIRILDKDFITPLYTGKGSLQAGVEPFDQQVEKCDVCLVVEIGRSADAV